MKRAFVAVAIVALILAGGFVGIGELCLGFLGSSQWELEVWVSSAEKLENGSVVIDGEVALSGHVTGTTIEGISIVFGGENITQQPVQVGSISGQSQQNFSVKVQAVPEIILIETGNIRTGDDTEYWIKGLERSDSGEYEQFIQKQKSC